VEIGQLKLKVKLEMAQTTVKGGKYTYLMHYNEPALLLIDCNLQSWHCKYRLQEFHPLCMGSTLKQGTPL